MVFSNTVSDDVQALARHISAFAFLGTNTALRLRRPSCAAVKVTRMSALLCSICKRAKETTEYSGNQLSKNDSKRKCKLCVAAL